MSIMVQLVTKNILSDIINISDYEIMIKKINQHSNLEYEVWSRLNRSQTNC